MTRLDNESGESLCPICRTASTEKLYSLEDVPVFCNVVHENREKAINAPKGVIELNFCNECGHIYNNRFDEKLMNYSVQYENSLHFSPRFQQFAGELAAELINKYGIIKKNVIEIGCGKGDFLKIVANLGNNQCYGFDASYEFNGEEQADNVSFYQEFYSDKYANIPADLVLCRHVLEHIDNPRSFVNSIGSTVNHYKPVYYFEVPNVLYTLRDGGIWDLIYEHYSYFNPHSLARLFREAGFQIYSLQEVYNNQFLNIEFGSKKIEQLDPRQELSLEEVRQLALSFKKSYEEKITYWKDLLDSYRHTGKKVALWGGGSKGVTFLNVLKEYDFLQEVVDINPRKQGKYVSGTGQRYISPESLMNKEYDIIIIMNPIYTHEVKNTLAGMKLSPEIIEA